MKVSLFMFLVISYAFSDKIKPVRDYECISDRLQASHSAVYYNLPVAEIEAILANLGDGRHDTLAEITVQCK